MQEKIEVNSSKASEKSGKPNLPEFSGGSPFDFEFKNLPYKKPDKKVREQLIDSYKNKNTVIFLDGELIFSDIEQNIKLSTLKTDGSFFEKYKKETGNEKLSAYNKKYLNSGLKLTVDGSDDKELFLKVVIAGINDISHYSCYQIEKNSRVTVNEQFVINDNCKLNYFSETGINADSSLNLMSANLLESGSSHVIDRKIDAGDFSEFNLTYLHLSMANTLNRTEINLVGKGSSANVNTATFAGGHERAENLMRVKHLRKETKSYLNNVGIVNGSAEINIDCLSAIEKGNSKSETQQNIKIVNLTDEAKATANPQLIIDEFDVKAGHSAGVGVIDEEQIYYLMSRGLKRGDAMELLIMSYVNKPLEILGNKVDQEKVLKIIKNKIV